MRHGRQATSDKRASRPPKNLVLNIPPHRPLQTYSSRQTAKPPMSANNPTAAAPPDDNPAPAPLPRYPAAEEASMLAASLASRTSANALFAISDYAGAVA